MKEDLNLFGNEYNYFTTYFNVGYAIFLIVSAVLVERVSADGSHPKSSSLASDLQSGFQHWNSRGVF